MNKNRSAAVADSKKKAAILPPLAAPFAGERLPWTLPDGSRDEGWWERNHGPAKVKAR